MQNRRLWPTILMMAVFAVGCSSSQKSAQPPAAGAPASDSNAPLQPVPDAAPPPAAQSGGEPRAGLDAISIDPIYFAFNSDQVESQDRDKLHEMADYLEAHAEAELTISGHCDDRGTPEYNLALGDRRAQAVKAYLKRLGTDGQRINVVSYGAERPAMIGGGEDAWARNRRDEFRVQTPRAQQGATAIR